VKGGVFQASATLRQSMPTTPRPRENACPGCAAERAEGGKGTIGPKARSSGAPLGTCNGIGNSLLIKGEKS